MNVVDYDTRIEKTCADCGETKSVKEFELRYDGRNKAPRSYCNKCVADKRKRNKESENSIQKAIRCSGRLKEQRKDKAMSSKFILIDSRGSDRKKGLENDLDKEFIDKLILKGCSYCGETKLRMTADRIDNSKGHTKDNVVSACIRCNYLRRDMPHEAMVMLGPALKKVRIKGLFGDWTGSTHK